MNVRKMKAMECLEDGVARGEYMSKYDVTIFNETIGGGITRIKDGFEDFDEGILSP